MSHPPSSQRMVFVDVLRGMAILAVFFHHLPSGLGAPFGMLSHWGGRGVDLFFVLSGFLIGSTCLERVTRAPEAGAAAQSKAYWLLRSARILPLYFALLGLFLLELPTLNPRVAEVLRAFPRPFLTFTSNTFGQDTLELGVLWSLAIEEQFYLTVGVLMLLTARKREQLASAFLGLGLAAIAVPLVYRYVLLELQQHHGLGDSAYVFMLFHGSLSRVDQLGVGLLCAVAAPAFNRLPLARAGAWAAATSWAAVAAVVGVLMYFPHRPVVGFLALGVAFGACVLWSQRPAAQGLALGRAHAALLWPLQRVGQLSFGLYLFHPITRRWMEHLAPEPLRQTGGTTYSLYFISVWTAVTVVLAALSFRFFEEPLLAMARRGAKRVLARAAERGAAPVAPVPAVGGE